MCLKVCTSSDTCTSEAIPAQALGICIYLVNALLPHLCRCCSRACPAHKIDRKACRPAGEAFNHSSLKVYYLRA